ncbi:hypothetical protein GCM10009754_21880 [Amycolatopsis minnesotensis]|uniref:Uncharacterized protein n=1 Tax=Amycolatopsis minnesotensis TaxID=337894 RepID=A0ABN2QIF7_9PSEU
MPRTLNGRKCEVPVKKILSGVAPERAVSRDALADPGSPAPFVELVPPGWAHRGIAGHMILLKYR